MPRRRRRDGNSQGILPLRERSLAHTVSCWYCDFKTTVLNERLYAMGRQHSKFLQLWFTMGIGVSFLAMFGVILILIRESRWLVASHEEGNTLMEKSKKSLYAALPVVPGLSMPVRDIGYLCIGTVLSVGFHEFGHALAAASEGVHVEYIAVFLAILFPGAFVAINYDRLEILSCSRVLRIYCAGVWHNAVCCAACWLTLALLPVVLHLLYTHGENPVVLSVPPTSSLAGYLSPGEIILEIDNIKVSNPKEWLEKLHLMHLQVLDENSLLDDFHVTSEVKRKQIIHLSHFERGFCVPDHWLPGSQQIEGTNNSFTCLDGNIPFIEISCPNASTFNAAGSTNFSEILAQKSFCLRAKDVVQLSKCGSGWSQSLTADICQCSESELCMKPVLSPGSMLIEITYLKANTPDCLSGQEKLSAQNLPIGSEEMSSNCQSSLLFVGDALSLAYSIELTAYKPQRLALFNSSSPYWLPSMLEKTLMYTFHISAGLGLLNSAPVYYLDGESMLETIISIVVSVHPRKKRRILSFFLMSGTLLLLLSILSGIRKLIFGPF
ncbi:membrane-bound transcription factor site-2 protease homolog [Cryptomeria japonica]|uniref:membrane-bound transcription factor site-2 protease homolog n=1 Tax=Cryptomeria japonica TaxID=3369 RepID=UPI0025AC0776|nr:membrane-bound transcription factor site-2 protease homolog [Cryptomeria japonica]